jgi:AraC-like DNA-binding protein
MPHRLTYCEIHLIFCEKGGAMALVGSYVLMGYDSVVRALGGNPQQLLAAADIPITMSQRNDMSMSYVRYADLLENTSQQLKQPYFGFLLSQQQSLDVLGVLPLVAAQFQTVGEAIEQAANAIAMQVTSGLWLDIQPTEETYILTMSSDVDAPLGMSQLKQITVAHLAMFLEAITGKSRYDFAARSSSIGGIEAEGRGDLLYKKVQFNCLDDSVIVSRQDWQKPNHLFTQAANQHIQKYLQFLSSQTPLSLEDEVREMIRLYLPTFDCTLERVARALNLQPRNLQLKLKQRGSSYSMLLAEIRQHLAVEGLRRKGMTVTDLSLRLGFSDVSIFSRTFKQWMGVSPQQWQRQHTQAH